MSKQNKVRLLTDALERAKNRIKALSEILFGKPDPCLYIDKALSVSKEVIK